MQNGHNLSDGKAPRKLAVEDNKLVMVDGSSVEEYFASVKVDEGRPVCLIYSDTLEQLLFERWLTGCA